MCNSRGNLRNSTTGVDDSLMSEVEVPRSSTDGITKGIERASTIVAPATLATALLVYVGWIRNNAYFGYFGINQGILNLSIQDYVVRSVDVTFGALARLVTVAVSGLLVERLACWLANRFLPHRQRKIVGTGVVGLGAALIAFGLAAAIRLLAGVDALTAAAVLGLGSVLVLRFHRPASTRWETVAATGALVLALFWSATVYAQHLGDGAAEVVDHVPSELPAATIVSAEPLDLLGPGVSMSPNTSKTVDYRYGGVFLLTYSNNRWFLLVPGTHSARSSVVVVPDGPNLRVELSAGP